MWVYSFKLNSYRDLNDVYITSDYADQFISNKRDSVLYSNIEIPAVLCRDLVYLCCR